MARTKIPLVITLVNSGDGDLTPVATANVSCVNRLSSATQPIYATESTNTAMTQPVTTDASGRVPGYIDRAPVVFTVAIPGHASYTVDWDSAPASDGAVTTVWIADAAITTAKIVDGAVTGTKLAANAITTTKITDATITLAKLAGGTAGQLVVINGSGIPAYATSSGDVTVNSSGAFAIGAAKVTAAMLATGAVTTAKIVAGAVTATELGAASVTNSKMNLTTVTGTVGGSQVNLPSSWTTVVTLTTPAAATYLAIGMFQGLWTPGTANGAQVRFSTDTDPRQTFDIGTGPRFVPVTIAGIVTLNGSTDFKLQAMKKSNSPNVDDLVATSNVSTNGYSRLILLPIG